MKLSGNQIMGVVLAGIISVPAYAGPGAKVAEPAKKIETKKAPTRAPKAVEEAERSISGRRIGSETEAVRGQMKAAEKAITNQTQTTRDQAEVSVGGAKSSDVLGTTSGIDAVRRLGQLSAMSGCGLTKSIIEAQNQSKFTPADTAERAISIKELDEIFGTNGEYADMALKLGINTPAEVIGQLGLASDIKTRALVLTKSGMDADVMAGYLTVAKALKGAMADVLAKGEFDIVNGKVYEKGTKTEVTTERVELMVWNRAKAQLKELGLDPESLEEVRIQCKGQFA